MTQQVERVCVLTNFRAGSSAFTLLKSLEYGLPFCGEVFAHERPWGIGKIPAAWQERDLAKEMREKGGKYDWPYQNQDVRSLLLNELENGHLACFKLMPIQVRMQEEGFAERVANACDKVYLLYRRDYIAQCLSWIGMRCTATGKYHWGDTGFKKNWPRYGMGRVDRNINCHLADSPERLDERVIREIEGEVPQERVDKLVKEINENYVLLSELYKKLDNVELVCMEDFFANTPYMKYNHEFRFENKPEIENLDVEALFK